MASGMPWPLMTGDHFASNDTAKPPAAASTRRIGPGWKLANEGRSQPHWWKSTTFVSSPIRWMSTQAAPPPASPRSTAMAERKAVRRACALRDLARAVVLRAAVSLVDVSRGGGMVDNRTPIVTRYIVSQITDVDFQRLLEFRIGLR